MPVIPPEWQPKYIIKRIDSEDIVIPSKTRDIILQALDKGLRFVQVGEYTLMLNAIRSIDPFWGPKNIPPRPKEIREFVDVDASGSAHYLIRNQGQTTLWDQLFSEKAKQEEIEEWMTR